MPLKTSVSEITVNIILACNGVRCHAFVDVPLDWLLLNNNNQVITSLDDIT